MNPNEWVANDKTLAEYIQQGIIPTFALKRDALAKGKLFGWRNTIKIGNRYLVAQAINDAYDLPVFEWTDRGQIIVRIRKRGEERE